MQGDRACRLYLISPTTIDADQFATALADAATGGDIACLQLRLKETPDADILDAAQKLQPVCAAHDIALLINDRPDLAAACGADGCHIGQEDMGYADARRLLGDDAIIGVTCHDSRDLAIEAADQGADYVAFGAFFETTTKTPKSRTDVEILKWWSAFVEVPVVAIGGITAENCGPLVAAGADFLAVMGGVWTHPDGPAAGVAAMNAAIARHVASSGAT